MIVQELIAKLSRLDSDTEVSVSVSSREGTFAAELDVVVSANSEKDGAVKCRLIGEVDPGEEHEYLENQVPL